MRLIREQRNGASRLVASRLVDFGSPRNDPYVAVATISGRNLTVARIAFQHSRLLGEISRLMSEIGSFRALPDELDVF